MSSTCFARPSRRMLLAVIPLLLVGEMLAAQTPPCARLDRGSGPPPPSWRLTLDQVRVDHQRESGGDRPYFMTIWFRSRLFCSRSTAVTLIEREPHDWVSKREYQGGRRLRRGDHLSPGESLPIPGWMGTMTWDSLPVVATNAAGVPLDTPWLFGAVILAFDNNNTPPHEMRRLAQQVADNLRGVLVDKVERGTALAWVNAGIPRDQQDSLARTLTAGLVDVGRVLQLTIGSTFQPDRITGIQAFVWPAVRGLASSDSRPVVRLAQPTSSFVLGIHQSSPAAFRREFVFEGSGALYTVPARFEQVSAALTPTRTLRTLRLQLTTGDDDLRDDSEVQLVVEFRDPRSGRIAQLPFAVNRERRGSRVVRLSFGNRQEWSRVENIATRGLRVRDIRRIGVRFVQGGGGTNGDNWNLDAIRVDFQLTATGPGPVETGLLLQRQGRPLHRFTGTPRPNEWWSGVLPTFGGS